MNLFTASTKLELIPLKTAEKSNLLKDVSSRKFHVMIKPGGAKCNIDCQYCFYLHKEELLSQSRHDVMDDVTLENFIRTYIESHDGDEIVFSWQGGEPTLLGIDFYRKVVVLQKKYRPKHIRIENDLQTNGLLLNDEWCRFLKENNFLVGLSIDGPKSLHDTYRLTRSGKPTFARLMKAVECLKRHDIKFNALVTVNNVNVRYPLEVYRFVTQELGATYVQFSPCVEPVQFENIAPHFWHIDNQLNTITSKPQSSIEVTEWSVSAKEWGDFLIAVFTEWVNNDLGRVLVNLFETAVAQVMGLPAQLCTTSEFCGKGIAIEKNGDVYACDHYVYPEYKLANVNQIEMKNMVFSTRQFAFGMAKRDTLSNYCHKCDYLNLCWGECPKNRIIKTPDGKEDLNYLCEGIKKFFDYALPIIVGITTVLKG